MQINIKILPAKTLSLEVNPSISVHELKTLIEAHEGMEHGLQRLQLKGKILLDFFSLNECEVLENSTIVLTNKVKVPRATVRFQRCL